MTINS